MQREQTDINDPSLSTAQQVTGTARDQARDLSGRASDATREVASTARHEAAEVAQEAGRQLQSLVEEARGSLRSRVDEQTGEIQHRLEDWAGQARALSEGRVQDAPAAARYAGQVAERIDAAARRIETRGVDGMVRDIEHFARRRPGAFLLGAAVLGFGVGRIVRGAKGAEQGANAAGRRSSGWEGAEGPNSRGVTAGRVASGSPGLPAPAGRPPSGLSQRPGGGTGVSAGNPIGPPDSYPQDEWRGGATGAR